MPPSIDPITLEIIQRKTQGIVRQMQELIYRTGYSTIIKESKDASAAITTAAGELACQAMRHPLHIGVFPTAVKSLYKYYGPSEIEEGDIFIVNDPYVGGSPHASDLFVIAPVFYRGNLIAFCTNIAHKPDIGGTVPGSAYGGATELFQEGLQLPVVKFRSKGKPVKEIENIISRNSRVPDLILGDIRGQIGCTGIGSRRLLELVARYSAETVLGCFQEMIHRTEQRVLSEIDKWPQGAREAEGFLDPDDSDPGNNLKIHVAVTVDGRSITFDFSKSSSQSRGPTNIGLNLVEGACQIVLLCMIDPALPVNHGLSRPIRIICPEGSILNPRYPAARSAYASSNRLLLEVLLLALGKFFPARSQAGGGSGGAVSIGGSIKENGQSYVLYELLSGGNGALNGKDGLSAISQGISNSPITPVEMVESEFPILMENFELIPDSGGAGLFRGGLGYRRTYRVLEPGVLGLRSDRHKIAPAGILGGKAGKTGSCMVNPGSGKEIKLGSKFGGFSLRQGDVVRVEASGGGGFGNAFDREANLVLQDVRDSFVSLESALKDYGVSINPANMQINEEETRIVRSRKHD